MAINKFIMMVVSNCIFFFKDGALSRDEMRIKLKREANEQRRLRLLDARKRVIGLDVDALNEQVAEKERMKSDMKEIERLESMNNTLPKIS